MQLQDHGGGNEDPVKNFSGVVRAIDRLGRVVIPAEMRKALGIRHGYLVETRLEDGCVVTVKIHQGCVLCGADDDLVAAHGKHVCKDCIHALVDRTTRDSVGITF
jgi:transcriptional pleiotropic regulator of transition state genes